jgi:hypothetical protein
MEPSENLNRSLIEYLVSKMMEMSSGDKSITAVVSGTADDEYLCVNVLSNLCGFDGL